jgi:hypothetical protein
MGKRSRGKRTWITRETRAARGQAVSGAVRVETNGPIRRGQIAQARAAAARRRGAK